MVITQKGAKNMIDGILVGATRIFFLTDVPAGSVFPPGVIPQWTSSDVTVATVESPNSDATGDTIKVTGVATGSFTLSASATLPNGTIVSGKVVVPVLAPAAPVPTSLAIDEEPAA
jgi:hypothetical protein